MVNVKHNPYHKFKLAVIWPKVHDKLLVWGDGTDVEITLDYDAQGEGKAAKDESQLDEEFPFLEEHDDITEETQEIDAKHANGEPHRRHVIIVRCDLFPGLVAPDVNY